jgi:protein-disulfide isomerase-like protein with CxxC motif
LLTANLVFDSPASVETITAAIDAYDSKSSEVLDLIQSQFSAYGPGVINTTAIRENIQATG